MTHCQVVMVDGEPVLVHVTEDLTAEEQELFAEIVRAARRKHAEKASGDGPGCGHARCRPWPVCQFSRGPEI